MQVSFKDGDGYSETVTSLPFGPVAEPASSLPASTLVSNTGQSASATAMIDKQYALEFTLGDHGQGYEISSVSIELAAVPSDLTVSLWIGNHSNRSSVATTKLFDFKNPASFIVGLNKFTAPAGVLAYHRVRYYIVLSDFGSSLSIKETMSDAEDAGGETGAELGDKAHLRALNETGRWSGSPGSDSVLRLALEGSRRASGILVSTYAQPSEGSQEIISVGDDCCFRIGVGAADRYLTRGFSWNSDSTSSLSGGISNPWDLREGTSSTGAKLFRLINTRNAAGITEWTAPQGATVAGGSSKTCVFAQDLNFFDHLGDATRTGAVLTRVFSTSSGNTDTDRPTAPGVTLSHHGDIAVTQPIATVLGEPLHAMVQNLGQTDNSYVSLGGTNLKVASQGFTTGSDAFGYRLQGIGVNIEGSVDGNGNAQVPGGPSPVSVAVHADSSGQPGAKLFDLVSPTEFGAGHSFFEAPPETTLDGSTSYVLVWRYNRGTWHRLQKTSSDSEDTGVLTDFSIANAFYRGADLSSLSEDSGGNALGIAVYGGRPASRVLVSNVGQGSDDVADTSGNDHAQLFHTAGATNGYTLTSVELTSEDAEGDAFDVDICAEDGGADEFPSTTASDCTALAAPMSFTAGNLEFTHAGLALSANTNYVVVIKPRTSASVAIDSTTSGGEDTTGLAVWSIKDYFYYYNSSLSIWANQSAQDEAIQITVNGYERAAVPVVVTPPVVTAGTEIWTGTVTAASVSNTDDSIGYLAFGTNIIFGSLSDTDFDFQGTSYTIRSIILDNANVPANTTQLVIALHSNITARTVGDLVLTVNGSASYAFTSAASSYTTLGNSTNFVWDDPGLSAWAASDMISMSLRDTAPVAPTVTAVELVPYDIPTSGIGVEVEALVSFSAAVDVTGTPQLELDFAGTPKVAACGAATNTTSLVCGYTVVVGDSAPNGIAIAANKLTLNGGTITATGSTTITADLAHAAVAANANHKVDGIRPTLVTTGSESPTTSTDGTQVTLTFSEDISAVTLGSVSVIANSTSGYEQGATVSRSGRTVTLTLFPPSLTIAAGWTVAVALSADAVEDAARNGNLALAATAVTNAIGTTTPTVAGVALTSDPGADNTYAIGDSVEATVTFSFATNDSVDITGTPQLELDFAGTPKPAGCLPDTGTSAMSCIYTVVAGDSAPNGVAIAANTLTLNGGTITATSSTTTNADLAHAAVAINAQSQGRRHPPDARHDRYRCTDHVRRRLSGAPDVQRAARSG